VVRKGVRFELGGYGVYRGPHIFFSFGVCAGMIMLGGLKSQRLFVWMDACVAWWLWLVICERVVRLFG